MTRFSKFYKSGSSFGGGLVLPSSISFARQARKFRKKRFKEEARKRKLSGLRGKMFF